MKILKEKTCYFKGFGFHYLKVLTDEGEFIKGGSLYLFGKSIVTMALSNGLWTSDDGKPYNFKIIDKVLYIRKFSISFD